MEGDKVITIPVTEITHMKVILATWYSFLRDNREGLTAEEFDRFLKTPVIYNLEKDGIELLITGSENLLQRFNRFVLNR